MKFRLKETRTEANLSQNELARRSGVPQPVIQYIEAGKTNDPRINTLSALAKTLGTTVDYLIGGDANEAPDNRTDG